MRELKFRVWDKKNKELLSWDDLQNYDFLDLYSDENFVVSQFVGASLNGEDLYEGDVVYCETEGIYDVVYYDIDCLCYMCKRNSLEVINGEVTDWDSIKGNVFEDAAIFNFDL